MVLSNKKLKQKLREEAKTLNLTNSITKESLIKSKLKRKEKKIKSISSKKTPLILNNNGESETLNLGNNGENKKKRKREENGQVKNENDKKMSVEKKKKKKKKKKSEIKSENVGKKEIDNVSERIGIKIIETNIACNGQDTLEAATEESAMKVYVGGIPYYSTEDDIRSYFESCGTITEIDCMMFPESGKFRGIAIISFKTDAAAKRALALDGSDMGGLFLKVVPYKSTKAKKHSEDFTPSVIEGYNRIYAGNLSWDITEDDLKSFFAGCNISSIRFGEDKESGEFRGYAHVDFADSLSLNKALKLDQEIVCGRPVRVRCAVPPKKKLITGNAPKVIENSPKVNETYEVVTDNVADVTVAAPVVEEVSGKIRRRTCYECGEKGHLSSACLKQKAADEANGGETAKVIANPPKVNETYKVATDTFDADVTISAPVVEEVSGKIRRRTCYECGEKGHLSSACPKQKAADEANGGETAKVIANLPKENEMYKVATDTFDADLPISAPVVEEVSGKIRRRTCYECGEKGHLSSACPKKKAS